MTFWKSVVLSTLVFAAFSFVRPAHSQVSVGVNIGAHPALHVVRGFRTCFTWIITLYRRRPDGYADSARNATIYDKSY